ncbi:hypothetical protein [Nostoc sp. UHCC 0870]|uniref:hypothetical protein n=1 Tax=Nostoc sp. UHCC 0870 TaxID=2914041 RepID=UPI001EDDFE74|nr:hypothetical protein [Nostoc sp. UHCC 0870]UKO98055.1 hypothetical protein L6494_26505 [Nostoc sp. UHCC 0870]
MPKVVDKMGLRWTAVVLGLTVFLILSIFAEIKPTQSKVPQLSNAESVSDKLEIVKKRADLIRLNGQKVKLIGLYKSKTWKPDPRFTGIPDFPGLYTKSQIVLEDRTEVSIFPSWNKQSLRSPDEVEKYNNQIVAAIGVVQFEAALYPNSQTRESFINLGRIDNHPHF